ncbi:MAG: carbonic anhydrase [Oscillospiraceae bacterium]|nr:carbonic anhydrase [Oscillospiraceae bacterium]
MNSGRALERLKEGCKDKRTAAAEGQWPFAAVLGCSDSRVPPELLFGCGPGDLFVVRTGGNIADAVAVGSLEFAAKHLGAKLILVLGHTHCGAVNAKAAGEKLGSYMDAVMDAVLPDVEANVRNTVGVLQKSPVLAALERDGVLQIHGAVYDLETGTVDFLS